MKNRKLSYKAFGLFAFTVLFIAVIVGSMFALSGFLGAGSSKVIMGDAMVTGTVTTEKVGEASEELLKNHISKKITKIRPASVPLDTIMREIVTTTPIKSFRTEFYSVDTKEIADTMASAYAPDDTSVGDTYAALSVSNVNNWNVDDTIMIPSCTGSDGMEFVGIVSAVDRSAGTVSVYPLNGDTNDDGDNILPIAIAEGATLVRMGNAKSELDAQTSAFAMMPQKDYNYVQNFMAQVEESTFQRLHDQEVDWGFSDYEEGNIYDMRRTTELSYLFGYRNKFTDPEDSEVKYTCNGIIRYISKQLEYTDGAMISNATWIDWTKNIFVGNAGSEKRIMFVGDSFLSNIALGVDSVAKQIDAKSTEVLWGITFHKIETPHGLLYIKRHPEFENIGMGSDGLVLDVNHLEKHVFQTMTTKKLDLKTPGIRNADAVVLQEVSCPILRYPDCHAIIRAV